MTRVISGNRLAAAVLATGAALLMAGGVANAAPGPAIAAPSTVDLQAAHDAASTPAVQSTLGGFFAGHGKAGVAANASVRPSMGRTVAVYYLNPAFVAAKDATVPVATQAFLATAATGENGQRASVWTVRQGSQWVEVNIASGSDEIDYADQAAAIAKDAKAFYEPQLHAWYALAGDRVVPLDVDAKKAVGAAPLTVTQYQQAVRGRYADKLPGSPYAQQHQLGGINPGGVRPVAAPAPSSDPGSSESGALPVVAAAAGVGVVGTALFLRRRSRATS